MIEPTFDSSNDSPTLGGVRREAARVTALFHGHTIASSTDVMTLDHQRYFPREDVGLSYLRAVDTHQDERGTATRYTIYRDGEVIENGAWSYDATNEGFTALAGRVAFRDDLVSYDVSSLDGAPQDDGRSWNQANEPSQRDGAPDAAPLEGKSAEFVRTALHSGSGLSSSEDDNGEPNVIGREDRAPGAPDQPFKGTGSI